MIHNWRDLGFAAPGGTVLRVEQDTRKQLWLASPAGLFTRNGDGWHPVASGLPFWRVNMVLTAGKTVWVSGLPHGLMRSSNGGRTWHRCWVDQSTSPILSMAASPSFSSDRVLLAGTDGDGILRSTDGGKYWRLANFGLREFVIYDLAVAPVWGRKEYAFAVTDSGIYQTPNGGRAWRPSILPANVAPVIAVATSPQFATDQSVYAGCEDGTLLISTDAGRQFERLSARAAAPINALAFDQNSMLLLGTMAGIQQYAPATGQLTKSEIKAPVLTLSIQEKQQFAGLIDGLYQRVGSQDAWKPLAGLAARRFVWYQTVSEQLWLAGGPEEGIYASIDGGHQWRHVWSETPVLALAHRNGEIIVSTPAGLSFSQDQGTSWSAPRPTPHPFTTLAGTDDDLWAGSSSGYLYHFDGTDFKLLETPFDRQQLLGLFCDGKAVVAASWSAAHKELQIWHLSLPHGGWRCWLSKLARPLLPHIAFVDDDAGTLLVGAQNGLYRCNADGVQGGKLPDKTTINGIAASEGRMLVVRGKRLFELNADGELTQLEQPAGQRSIITLHILSNHPSTDKTVWMGTTNGQIYVGDLANIAK